MVVAINFNVAKKVKNFYEAVSSGKFGTDDLQMIQISFQIFD